MIRVHVVTLSRSDYASVGPVARAAEADPEIDAKVIAGGSHLLNRFGRTIDSVLADGYRTVDIVDFLREQDDHDREFAQAYGRAVENFLKVLSRDPPDRLFILGDRWELLAAATAATMLRIPLFHHSGGDITQGSADNQTRYALTALSHIHLTALDEHAQRLLRMGEEPWRVRVTGEPALTGLGAFQARDTDVRSALGLNATDPFVLATFHPTTYDSLPLPEQLEVFRQTLDHVHENIILTAPNPDPGSGLLLQVLSTYARMNPRVRLFSSLGAETYHAAMARARFMVGNSSSGLWEAPSFGLPVVNIGNRQMDRRRGRNVVDAALDIVQIKRAIDRVRDPLFRDALPRENPYVLPDTLERILASLKMDLSVPALLAKKFQDPLVMSSQRGNR